MGYGKAAKKSKSISHFSNLNQEQASIINGYLFLLALDTKNFSSNRHKFDKQL
jgi:hypothetical protein